MFKIHLYLIIAAVVVVLLLLYWSKPKAVINGEEIGVVERKYFGKNLPAGRVIALPYMVARIGSLDNLILITNVVHPNIDSSFRNQAGSVRAYELTGGAIGASGLTAIELMKLIAGGHITITSEIMVSGEGQGGAPC